LKGQVKGDADTQLLENAVRTSASEYAKVMSGGTGTAAATEGVREEAAKSLNASFSNNTTKKVIEQMKLEMRKRMDGFDQQIEETKKTLKENPASAKPSNAAQYLQLIK
jgi:Flp pilus assembly protein TadB